MRTLLFQIIAFGCLGITTEIFFTAISDFIAEKKWQTGDFSMTGHSYIWMFLIYGSAPLFFSLLFTYVENLPLIARLFVYGFGILAVEFVAGGFLDLTTGSCPWEYDSKWAIMGYIRLDYLPFWMGFGFILEYVYKLTSSFSV